MCHDSQSRSVAISKLYTITYFLCIFFLPLEAVRRQRFERGGLPQCQPQARRGREPLRQWPGRVEAARRRQAKGNATREALALPAGFTQKARNRIRWLGNILRRLAAKFIQCICWFFVQRRSPPRDPKEMGKKRTKRGQSVT